MDALARRGARFDRAFATAPLTLTSHASLLTGRYPPGHGARHNGMRMRAGADACHDAAVAGLRHRRLRRGLSARPALRPRRRLRHLQRSAAARQGWPPVERAPGAGRWPTRRSPGCGPHRSSRSFAWVHFFEPHAPYGPPDAIRRPRQSNGTTTRLQLRTGRRAASSPRSAPWQTRRSSSSPGTTVRLSANTTK